MNPRLKFKIYLTITSILAMIASVSLLFSVAAFKVARDSHVKAKVAAIAETEESATVSEPSQNYQKSYTISACCFVIFLILLFTTAKLGQRAKASIGSMDSPRSFAENQQGN